MLRYCEYEAFALHRALAARAITRKIFDLPEDTDPDWFEKKRYALEKHRINVIRVMHYKSPTSWKSALHISISHAEEICDAIATSTICFCNA